MVSSENLCKPTVTVYVGAAVVFFFLKKIRVWYESHSLTYVVRRRQIEENF